MTDEQRLRKLLRIAAKDPFYTALYHSFENSRLPFHQFIVSQNPRATTIVNTYVYTGEMLLQQLARLACAHMVFPDEA